MPRNKLKKFKTSIHSHFWDSYEIKNNNINYGGNLKFYNNVFNFRSKFYKPISKIINLN